MHSVSDLEIVCLPLPPTLRQKLVGAGFRTVQELAGISTLRLANELQIGPEEALAIIRAAAGDHPQEGALQGAKSAAELLEKEKSARKILTFCGELDIILGGGICTGQITEFCGVPAVGKTQIGIQLSIDVQIPRMFSGLEGKAIYIDTEGSFFVERVKEMAEAFVKHMKKLAGNSTDPARRAAVNDMTWETVLDKIHYFRVHDLTEQLAVMGGLASYIEQVSEVKLVVVDSVTFHLRQDISDMAHRTRLLAQMAQDLMRLAEQRDLAIVLMNHVTTKISAHETRIVPALGDSWAHAATNRVILFWRDQQRCAYIYKSPSLPARTAEYLITREGVRGHRASHKRSRE